MREMWYCLSVIAHVAWHFSAADTILQFSCVCVCKCVQCVPPLDLSLNLDPDFSTKKPRVGPRDPSASAFLGQQRLGHVSRVLPYIAFSGDQELGSVLHACTASTSLIWAISAAAIYTSLWQSNTPFCTPAALASGWFQSLAVVI